MKYEKVNQHHEQWMAEKWQPMNKVVVDKGANNRKRNASACFLVNDVVATTWMMV